MQRLLMIGLTTVAPFIGALETEVPSSVTPAAQTHNAATPSAVPMSAFESQVYTHPGIVVNQGGRWVGSDHLLNLSRNVRIVSEILKPADATLPFNEASLDKTLQEKFSKHGFDINGQANSAAPFFNLLIVVYPIEQGYVSLVDGRLMEGIDPKRVKLDPDTSFQAITWEKKTLLVSPKDEFEATINKSIDDIINTFFERYDYFDRLKVRMEQKNESERMR